MEKFHCRFNDVFARDEQGLPRNWSPSANIPNIAQQARQSAARLLAMLAVIRLHATKVDRHFQIPDEIRGSFMDSCCMIDCLKLSSSDRVHVLVLALSCYRDTMTIA